MSVNLAEQILLVACDVVYKARFKRFLISEGLRLAHGALRHLDIASALGDHRPHQRGGIILDLLSHDLVGLPAADGDWVCRAGVGSGGHRRNVGGYKDEKTG